ncbi:MAG: IS1595 family transposase [Caulobacteraceae bacterium]
MSVLSAPHFHNEEAAYAYVEARLWPNGPVCPHCGGVERVGKMGGKSTRIGAYKCYQCRKPFTVKVGTIFESSHVPMRHWLQAMFLMASSKKGVSANQLYRTLGCTLKTAWFIEHRIREAMSAGSLAPFGGGGGDVEVDETFIGFDPMEPRQRSGYGHKLKVMTLVDRTSGQIESVHMEDLTAKGVAEVLGEKIDPGARLITDSATHYRRAGRALSAHESVNHSVGEYVRADDASIHTNTVEGTFSIFKRGMRGVYQHCAKKHLHRYLAEFDFRYSNRIALGIDDVQRADNALKGVRGKRLTYQTVSVRRPGAETRVVW